MIAKRARLYCRVENGWDWDSYELMERQTDFLKEFCQEHALDAARVTTSVGSTLAELLSTMEQLAAHGKGLCMVQDNIATIQISGFAPPTAEDMP